MHLREDQFERATELFYEAAAVPELWPNALQAVADACGAHGALFLPVGPAGGSIHCNPSFQEYTNEFVASGWYASNSRMERGLALTQAGMKGLITDTDMFTPDELARDAYYNEWLVPHRMGATAGVVIAQFKDELAMPFTLERRAASGPFATAEIARMNQLIRILKPAADLALRAGFAASKRIADGLSGAGKEITLLGASGRVLHLSPGVERQIGDGLMIRGGHLRSWHGPSDEALTLAIRRAVQNAPAVDRNAKPVALPRRHRRRPLMAQVVPIAGAGQDVFMLARAALILTDPDVATAIDHADEGLKMMGLTAAEIRLAKRIGAGDELKAIADAEGIAIETARARLKAVFGKTGTHRQAELAILIARFSR